MEESRCEGRSDRGEVDKFVLEKQEFFSFEPNVNTF
jgi:hypothetical protein